MENVCQYFSGQNQRAARSHDFFGAEFDPGRMLRACSSCAGDYEDPDRTAWPTDLEEPEAEDENGLLIHVDENGNADEDASARNTSAADRERFPAQ